MRATLPALALAAAVSVVSGSGCAASSSGIVPGFDGSFTVSKRGVAATPPATLTKQATQEATAHCTAQGKRFRQVDLKESTPGTLAPQAESELTFVCE